ncbi:MAG TPA: hypothetical protein VFV95_05055 [Vicinamibacterales bacterium]|nr:hypothetical protein [Vicinamibacterales bacterium]
MTRVLLVVVYALCVPLTVFAQQRPLVTEDPETVGAGRVLVEGGFDYGRGVEYSASGLQGNLLRVPLVGVSVGISSIAEVQIDGGLYNRLSITDRDPSAPLAGMITATGDTTWSVQDFVIGTKVRVVSEGAMSPGFGVRFATKLPNASNESGIGLDTIDFYVSVLGAKTFESLRVVGNLGVAILSDPTRGDRQDDALTYGASFARALTTAAEIVGEVNGHVDTRNGDPLPGTESSSVLRVGARYTVGSWRADAALIVGLADRDPGFGVAAGFTYVFSAFTVP